MENRFDNLEIGTIAVRGATSLRAEFEAAAIEYQRSQVDGGLYGPIIARVTSVVTLLRVAGVGGYTGDRLPKDYRLYRHQNVDAKGNATSEVWYLEKKANPYGEGEAWWTLNPDNSGPTPPRDLLRQFASDLEQGWLAAVLDDQAKWRMDAAALITRIRM